MSYGAVPKGNPRSLGFERYALRFDHALSQYIDCGKDPSLINLTAYSVEAFVKLKVQNYPGLINWVVGLNRPGVYLCWGPHGPMFYAGTNNLRYFDGSAADILRDGALHHVVFTIPGSNQLDIEDSKMYLDDSPVAVDSTVSTGVPLAKVNLYIGKYDYLDGLIPLLRIYDGVLTLDEIRWNRLNYHNPVRRDKLVLWLPMEEGAGLTTIDRSGHGNNGSLLPAATPPTWEQVRQYELRAQTEH